MLTGQRSSYDIIWAIVWSQWFSKSECEALETMFPNPDLESYQFNQLHKTVLGLNLLGVEQAYQQHDSSLFETDKLGFTPHLWAARRGDFETLKFLINKGADFHATCSIGRDALSYAANHGSYECTELLLRCKANVNGTNISKWTPLHRLAAGSDDLNTLECLLRHHADIDMVEYQGRTPLMCAIQFKKNQKFALRLILRGANIHIQDLSGSNSLCEAVIRNFHIVLKYLLQRGADHSGILLDKGSLLHLSAEYADTETLRLLANAYLKPRDILHKRSKDHRTALDVAKDRSDTDPGWIEAFQLFMQSVDQTKVSSRTKTQDSSSSFNSLLADDSDDEEDMFVDAIE